MTSMTAETSGGVEFPFTGGGFQPHTTTTDAPISFVSTWGETIGFYGFPVVFMFSLVFSLTALLSSVQGVRFPCQVYMFSVSLTDTLLVVVLALTRLAPYTPYSIGYQMMRPYLSPLLHWFRILSVWLLVCWSWERIFTLCRRSRINFSSSGQAWLVSLLVGAACLVTVFPQFYSFNTVKNPAGRIVMEKSPMANETEYRILYYWYLQTASLFVPVALLLITSLTLMCCLPTVYRYKRRKLQNALIRHAVMGPSEPLVYGNGNVDHHHQYPAKNYDHAAQSWMSKCHAKELSDSCKLLLSLSVLYFLLALPWTLLTGFLQEFMSGKILNLFEPYTELATDLSCHLFCLNSGFHFLLFARYSSNFRSGLRQMICLLCCCGCCMGKNARGQNEQMYYYTNYESNYERREESNLYNGSNVVAYNDPYYMQDDD